MTDIEFKMTPEHIDQLLVDAVLQSNAGDAIRKAAKKAIDDVIGTEWSRTSVVQEAVTKIIRDEATRIVNDELNDSIRQKVRETLTDEAIDKLVMALTSAWLKEVA